MNGEYRPLEDRERHIIEPGTGILGGKLLTRAAIVVDVEENPGPYNTVLEAIDGKLAILKRLKRGPSDKKTTSHDILKTTDSTVKRFIPFNVQGYARILSHEAQLRGVDYLTPEHELGLSRFIGLAGICHQRSLLSATMLCFMQERGDIGGTVSIEPVQSIEFPDAPLDHQDRHTRVVFTEGDQGYAIDTNTGVSKLREPGRS